MAFCTVAGFITGKGQIPAARISAMDFLRASLDTFARRRSAIVRVRAVHDDETTGANSSRRTKKSGKRYYQAAGSREAQVYSRYTSRCVRSRHTFYRFRVHCPVNIVSTIAPYGELHPINRIRRNAKQRARHRENTLIPFWDQSVSGGADMPICRCESTETNEESPTFRRREIYVSSGLTAVV